MSVWIELDVGWMWVGCGLDVGWIQDTEQKLEYNHLAVGCLGQLYL